MLKKAMSGGILAFAVAAGLLLSGLPAPARAAVGDVVNWYWGRSPHWYGGLTIKKSDGETYICENESATGYIFLMQPSQATANQLDTVQVIQLGIAKDAGITWDGDHNYWWVAGANWYFGIGKLPENGGNFLVSWIPPYVNPYGIDYYSDEDEKKLYVGTSYSTKYLVYDCSGDLSGANKPTFEKAVNVGFTPIAIARAGDYLWISDANPPFGVYKFDLEGNYQGEYFLVPDGQEPLSLAFDGQYLWSRTNVPVKIYQFDIGMPAPVSNSPVLDSGDYDGDSTSDLAVFRSTNGLWAVRGVTRAYFGREGDIPASGDFNGDGTTDPAIFRPSSGLWAARGVTRAYFGANGDIPVPGDYDGNGTVDAAVFRPTNGLWAIRGVARSYFGATGDLPVPSYIDGRGNAKKIGIFRSASGLWAIKGVTRTYFGAANDQPVIGSYSSGTAYDARPAIFRPASGLWAVKGVTRAYFGGSDDIPVPGNYNGFLPDQPAIFRSSSGLWAVRGGNRVYFGADGDIPVSGLAINPSTASQD